MNNTSAPMTHAHAGRVNNCRCIGLRCQALSHPCARGPRKQLSMYRVTLSGIEPPLRTQAS